MILHIKPTAKKDQVFRFKSNFIRFVRNFDKPETSTSQLSEGIEATGDGVSESIKNIISSIELIRARHSKNCADQIKMMLIDAANEMQIPID